MKVIIVLVLATLMAGPVWARSGYGPLVNGKDWRQIEQAQYTERPYSRTREQVKILEGYNSYQDRRVK